MQVMPSGRFKTFVELKDYIYSTLCQREQLALGAFPMTEQVLRRGDKLWGILFSVHGPRSVVFNAVLETEGNAVHFYSSTGQRFKSTPIGMAPPVAG